MFWDGTKWVDQRAPASTTRPKPPRERRVRDWLATLPILLLIPALLLPVVAASASSPAIYTSGTPAAGARLIVTGRGFTPRERIQLVWDGSAARMPQARVNSSGRFRTSFVVPASAKAGSHTLGAARLGGFGGPRSFAPRTYDRAPAKTAYTVVVADISVTVPSTTALAAPVKPSATPGQSTPTGAPGAKSAPTVAPATAGAADDPTSAPTDQPTSAPTSAPTPDPTPKPTPKATPDPTPQPTPKPTPKPTPDPVTVSGDCGGSLQSQINSTGAGDVLDLTGCSYSGSFTISKSMTLKGVSIDASANDPGITVTADNVTLDHVKVTGAQASTFRWDEKCIVGAGSSSNSVSGLVIKSSTITRCGYGGIYLHFASNATISSNKISNVVYAGILLSSVSNSKVLSNTITGVGVHGSGANSNNAYGITATQEDGPHSSDVLVQGNTVSDIPTWHGLDTHGGVRITFRDNTIFAVRRAIFLTSSPTDAVVDGNDITAPTAAQQGDCPSDAPDSYCKDVRGISLFGGSATIDDNTGHGFSSDRWWNYGGGSFDAAGNNPRIQ